MAIEHDSIPNSDIHEPKGADTAAADTVYVSDGAGSGSWKLIENATATSTDGAVLVSDGAGSGEWVRWNGFAQYQDTDRTVGTPTQTLTAGTRTLWQCDGGDLTYTRNPSDLAVAMWDTTNFKHVPIAEDDTYTLRVTFTAQNYAGSTPYIELELDIGGSVGVIYADSRALRKGGAAQALTFTIPVFTGSTYFANGGEIYVTYQGTGTCDIYKNDIFIRRESKDFT